MALARPRDPLTYLSPQHSPELEFGSPAISHSNWKHRCQESPSHSRDVLSSSVHCGPPFHPLYHVSRSLPSPPQQHEPSFAPAVSEYTTSRSIHNAPLSPPASDGIMSPPIDNEQEFNHKSMDPNMWMSNSYSIKTEDGGMPGQGQDSHSPPTLFIEDIFKNQELQPVGGGCLDDNGFGMSQANTTPKRDRNDHMLPARYHNPDLSLGGFMLPAPYRNSDLCLGGSIPPQPREKRHLTDASEANFHCAQCGKVFSRVWNYNAHLDTHNIDRPRPHICPERGCGKAFVRKTDLTRHTQCVHAKNKKFKCKLCRNTFARKDTLRRHEDDGCPKRVDIVSRHSRNKPIQVHSEALMEYLRNRPSGQQQQQYFYPQYESQLRTQQYDGALESSLPPLSNVIPIQKPSW